MTLLALPKPGPPYAEPSDDFAEASWSWKRLARLTPSRAEPPTRSNSRRVMPSHVSRPGRPGITSMVCHLSAVLQPRQVEKLAPSPRREGGVGRIRVGSVRAENLHYHFYSIRRGASV